MGLTRIEPEETVGAEREQPVVCIPVFGGYDSYVQCIQSVLAHTPREVPILVADDASRDLRIAGFLENLAASGALRHELYYFRQPVNLGFVGNVNSAFASSEPGDPVILNSDCIVSVAWLEGLRDAVYADTRTATATALTNHGTILSLPDRNAPNAALPRGLTVDTAAGAIRHHAVRHRPELPTALGHCFYIRRPALELVGGFDVCFAPGYGEEVDFSQRCLLHGLKHVVADDVFVYHRGSVSFTQDTVALQEKHEDLIAERYPYYHESVREVATGEAGPLPRAIVVARRALRGLSVTIDARILGPQLMGTQLVALELIWALAQRDDVRLRIVLPPDLGDYAGELLSELADVERLSMDDLGSAERTDIAHRPYQVSSHEDLELLAALGERTVISQLDLIAYDNPGYFASFSEWDAYRRLTREALCFADRIVFISRTGADDALAAELIGEEHVAVIHPGTDHRLAGLRHPAKRPTGIEDGTTGFLLVLGTDYRHKNRVFALRLHAELTQAHAWDGRLVFAGPRVPHGSSVPDEASFLAANPELAEGVLYLAAVEEREKTWLLEHAAAVVYPSTYEGFGLVPFEAAAAGVPCFFAPQTSLTEVLPAELARLVSWDPRVSAQNVIQALRGTERDKLVDELQAAGSRYTWRSSAEQTVALYEQAVSAQSRPLRDQALNVATLEHRVATLDERLEAKEEQYDELIAALGEDGLSLVGPQGVLPHPLRRPLLAVAARPWLRWAILGPLRIPYLVAYALRHRRLR